MSSISQKLFPKQQESGLDSTALFLSLYLVVLAFFILLNSISHPDGVKSKTVISSVTTTFEAGHDEPTLEIKKTKETPEGKYLNLGEYFAILKQLMEEEMHLLSQDINEQGNVMKVAFPTKIFFDTNKTEIRPEKKTFMEELARDMKPSIPGMRMDIEVILTSKAYMSEKGDVSLEIWRAGSFARKLESLGVDTGSINVGVVPGEKKEIRLTFYTRAEEDSNAVPGKSRE